MKYLALLLLTGCATTTLDDLYQQRAVCVSHGEECDDLDKKITQKEKIREWKKNTETPCPEGLIAYCDYTMYGCGKNIAQKPVEYYCVSGDQLRDKLYR